jgi:hypothetical protein
MASLLWLNITQPAEHLNKWRCVAGIPFSQLFENFIPL